MISVEEKLAVFTQYLLKKQRDAGKVTIDAAKEKREVLLKEAEEKLNEDRRNIEERNYHVIYRDKNKIIADGKNTSKNKLLEQRCRILDDFKDTILDISKDYVGTPEYNEYLDHCLQKIPENFNDIKNIRIFALKEDRDFLKKEVARILPDYTVTFENASGLIRGGLIVRDGQNRLNCDFTINNLIRDNSRFIGMRLNEMMDGHKEAVTQ